MTPGNSEFKTIRITPASMTRRTKFARQREKELADIESAGWEIVDVEPERFLRPGDKVTVRRAANAEIEPLENSTGWWDSLDARQKLGVGMCGFAVLVLVIGIGSML